jgi:hypothetical protein
MRRVRLQHLLGKKVIDPSGKSAGRIEELRAVREEGVCRVEQYVLGRRGMLERLSVANVSLWVLGLLGARRASSWHRVPWHQMDLSDPNRPKLKCSVKELEAMQAGMALDAARSSTPLVTGERAS